MPRNKSHDVPIACHRCTPGPDPPEACKGSSCCYFKKMSTDFKENEASIFYISKRNCKCTQKGCYVRFSSTIKESNTPKTSKLAVHQLLVVHQILCRGRFPSTCLEWNSLISIGKNMEIEPVRAWCVYFVLTKLVSCATHKTLDVNSTCLFFVCQHGFNCLLKQITLVLWACMNFSGKSGSGSGWSEAWSNQAAINAVDEHPATYINIWIEECLTLFNCVYPSQRMPDCVHQPRCFWPENKVKTCSCPQKGHLKLETLTSKASSSRSTCKYHGIKFPMKPNGDRTALWTSFFTNPSTIAHSDWQILQGADVEAQKQIAEHPTRSRISQMASHRLPLPCM